MSFESVTERALIPDPSTWVQALRAAHEAGRGIDVARIVMHETQYDAPQHANETSRDLWRDLLGYDMLECVMDIIRDNDLCGFSRDDLLCEAPGKSKLGTACRLEVVTYLIALLTILVDGILWIDIAIQSQEDLSSNKCRHHIRIDDPLLEHALRTFATQYPLCAEAIWKLADPLITCDVDFEIMDECRDIALGIGLALVAIQRILNDLFCSIERPHTLTQSLNECAFRTAKLQLAIWMCSKSEETTKLAFEYLTFTLFRSGHLELARDSAFISLFQDVVNTSNAKFANLRAVHGHLQREILRADENERPNFMTICRCAEELRPSLVVRITKSHERELLWLCMAAFRAETCGAGLHQYREEYHVEECSIYVACFLWTIFGRQQSPGAGRKPTIPEVWCHQALAIFAIAYPYNLEKNRPSEWIVQSTYARTLRAFLGMLIYYLHHPSSVKDDRWVSRHPPSRPARLYTLDAWSTAALNMQLSAQRRPSLRVSHRALFAIWGQIGDVLKLGYERCRDGQVVPGYELEFSKQCSNKDCACSVFEAIHKMKACRGCNTAWYCDAKCQQRDWERHRVSCGNASRSRRPA